MNDTAVGFVSVIVSCLMFGVMFTPLRRFDSGDDKTTISGLEWFEDRKNNVPQVFGFFVQWIVCAVVFVFGWVISIIRNFPPYQPIVIISAFLFTTGNVAAVPLINGLGMGPGMLMWGSTMTISGWCAGRFGWFGVKPQIVVHQAMNVSGLVIVLISGVMFMFVKHESQEKIHSLDDDKSHLDVFSMRFIRANKTLIIKKLFMAFLAIFIGVLHGFIVTPITYVIENVPGSSSNILDHLVTHYTSIFAFSTVYYFAYCVYKRNRPHAPANLVLPSAIYGILFSGATTLAFTSNRLLTQVVSLPITTRLPSTVGVLTDVFVFKTIKGGKNMAFLAFAILVGLTGDVLIALSNQQL